MKRLLALSALVWLTSATGTAIAGEVDMAVFIGVPAPVYATVQSYPEPIWVQEQYGQPYDQPIHATQYRHEAPRHHEASTYGEGRHRRYDNRRAHRENRSRDRSSSSDYIQYQHEAPRRHNAQTYRQGRNVEYDGRNTRQDNRSHDRGSYKDYDDE